jgi:hypothetical protein
MKIPRSPLAGIEKGVNPAVPMDTDAMIAPSRAAATAAYRVGEASDQLLDTAIKIQEEKDALLLVDHMTQLRNVSRDYVAETKKKIGKNALDLQPGAREWLSGTVDSMEQGLTTNRQRGLFKKMAAAEVDQTLNQVAAHEYTQLTQYRDDLRQNSINESTLAIRNAAGNQALIQKAVDNHVNNMNVIYHGQDTTDFKQADLSRLNLEALTQSQHWRHTTVANELMTKFAGDPEAMTKHLMDPNNYKELSIEEKQAIGTIVYSEFGRQKAFKKEQMEEQAQGLWADYYDARYGKNRGNPGALAKWHANVADLTRRGMIPSSVMQNAIQLEASEQASIRAAAAAGRAQKAWDDANNPLLKGDPKITAYFTELAAKDPGSLDIGVMAGYIGKGLSYKDFEHLSGIKKGKEKSVWTSPNGKLVGQELIGYKKNRKFGSDTEKNNEEFNVSFKKMEAFLMKNPDATAEQINTEMKTLMKPYLRNKILKAFDALTDGGAPSQATPTPKSTALGEEE